MLRDFEKIAIICLFMLIMDGKIISKIIKFEIKIKRLFFHQKHQIHVKRRGLLPEIRCLLETISTVPGGRSSPISCPLAVSLTDRTSCLAVAQK